MVLSTNRALVAASFLLLGAGAPHALQAQQAPPLVPPLVPPMEVGPLALRGYELREAKLDPPMRVGVKGGSVELKYFGWQVVIKGDHFPIRALDPILWLDDTELIRYDRCKVETNAAESLVYTFFDPKLLRSEHVMQVIYGKDERTRTKLMERFDPERLVRLPDAMRKQLGMPELESLTLTQTGQLGLVKGQGRILAGTIRLAARVEDGSLHLIAGDVALGADGTFTMKLPPTPAGTTQIVALLVNPDAKLASETLTKLPDGVELLDSKPFTR